MRVGKTIKGELYYFYLQFIPNSNFLLSTTNFNSDNIIEEKWNAINIACALYLNLIRYQNN